MILQHDRGISWVEYVAPPKPEQEIIDGKVIEIPEQEGTPTVVLTYENGMTIYLRREMWDWDAPGRYVAAITEWMQKSLDGEWAIGLPLAQYIGEYAWVAAETLHRTLNLHANVNMSPLAASKQRGGSRIIVPMGDGISEIPVHGRGKRKR
jgi:hypothetical protein